MDEPLAADSTLVRLLAGVGHDVMFEGFRLTEGTIAVGAVVRLDAAVNDFDVPAHVANVGEHLSTHVTGELLFPGVIIHVDRQLMTSSFLQTAQGTHVVSDALMSHHVLFQFVSSWKLLIANLALERHVP